MKKLVIICIFSVAICVVAFAVVYDESNFSAAGRMFQPAPDDQITGIDNAPGRGRHHPGEDCGRCHRVGGRAESYLWTMSGTLYQDRSGRAVLKGGEIIMQGKEGNVISMTTNAAGNFWTSAPIASDPYTVSNYHGHEPFVPMYEEDAEGNLLQPAPADDAKTWHYKTWVKKGKYVRPMMTIAGVGGNATFNRMTCNMHHGNFGHRGALWVGKGKTLPSYPDRNLSYRKHIYPILRSSCAPCHIPGKTNTSVNSKTDLPDHTPRPTYIDYSHSLDLVTYDGTGSDVAVPNLDPAGHYDGTYTVISKMGVLDEINLESPENSLLLEKTVFGGDLHGGGVFWKKNSPDYHAIRRWIAEGAEID